MPSVQLTRLRSQINAVVIHFQDGKDFKKSLFSLLELYSDQKVAEKNWFKQQSTFEDMHVPHSVMVELEAQLELQSKLHPDAALANADTLWESDRFEAKRLAIVLLSGSAKTQQDHAIDRIRQWISPDLDQRLMKGILEAFNNQPDILLNKHWIDSLSNWLSTDDDELRRLGLKAINETIRMNYENLPQIFSLLTQVIQTPRISIQKELVDVILSLIDRSEPETASFLIMAGTLYQSKDVRAFIRKCIPMFDPFFQTEIRSSLN